MHNIVLVSVRCAGTSRALVKSGTAWGSTIGSEPQRVFVRVAPSSHSASEGWGELSIAILLVEGLRIANGNGVACCCCALTMLRLLYLRERASRGHKEKGLLAASSREGLCGEVVCCVSRVSLQASYSPAPESTRRTREPVVPPSRIRATRESAQARAWPAQLRKRGEPCNGPALSHR